MKFMVRPFRQIVQRGPEQPASQLAGQVEGQVFRFSVDGAAFEIPALQTGSDKWGAFAVIEESQRELPGGLRLVVELDPPLGPDEPLECTIRLFKPHPELERLQAENPQGIVVLPVESSISVDFGPTGHVSGHGASYRTPYDPRNPPPVTRH